MRRSVCLFEKNFSSSLGVRLHSSGWAPFMYDCVSKHMNNNNKASGWSYRKSHSQECDGIIVHHFKICALE
jgi:hypothetical protein